MSRPSKDDLKARLTSEQYAVTQKGATERPFTGTYLDNKDDGAYRCVCCDSMLFSSATKFDSGSSLRAWAWVRPILPQPMRAVRSGGMG